MNGYIKGKADAGWWMQQLNAGIAFRKKYAKEAQWNTWRNYYRGNWKAGILPKNIFFSMLRTVVPRVYFRNPSVSVTATKPGAIYVAQAQVLERVDNKLINTMKMKRQIKRMVQNAFLFGTGFGKLGYGAEFTPTPEENETDTPMVKSHAVEYRSGIVANMPWFLSAHPGSIIVPSGVADFEEGRFIAHWIRRPVDDVTEDPRLKNVKQLGPSSFSKGDSKLPVPGLLNPTPMMDLVEIRDKKTRQVIVLAPYVNSDKVLFQGDDELQGDYGPTTYPLVFNEDDEVAWGIPDSVILEPHQLEINEIRTQAMKHRRVALVKLMYETGSITPESLGKLLSEDVLAGVECKDINKVKPMQIAEIPQGLLVADRSTMQDIREALGFGVNQMGEYKAGSSDTTATEAMIVKMATEIRVDERRDMVADLLTDVINDMHRIIFDHWRQEEVIDVVGPAGIPIWVQFSGDSISAERYNVKVDPDTAIPETRAIREQRAMLVYGQLKMNPLIDPIKLTVHLLHEMHGVQFDDMLRGLPPGLGSQQNPMSVGQYGQVLQGVASRVPQAQLPGQGGA